MRILVAALLIGVFTLSSVNAQNFTNGANSDNLQLNTITTAVPFLLISGNAFEMGNANVGVVSSNQYFESAFISNASLLANGQKYIGASLGYAPWLRSLVPDINLVNFSLASSFHRRHAVGFYFKYFDLGRITFTDAQGPTISDFKPFEYVVQLNYAHRFPFGLSVGIAGKYIYSNLTGGLNIGGADTQAATAGAADLGLTYRKQFQVTDVFGIGGSFGAAFNNIGSKMKYTNTNEGDFLPMNMMLGLQLGLSAETGIFRFENDFSYQITKLLVPTPPLYSGDPYIDNTLPPGDTLGAIGHPSNANPNFGSIQSGSDPNQSVFNAMFSSFTDAPGGTQEELNELMHHFSHEFRFILNDVCMVGIREGYFHEHYTKGNRQFVALGGMVGGAGFRFDFGGWIPTNGQNSPLQNTVFASLSYRMIIGKSEKLMRYPKWSNDGYQQSLITDPVEKD